MLIIMRHLHLKKIKILQLLFERIQFGAMIPKIMSILIELKQNRKGINLTLLVFP